MNELDNFVVANPSRIPCTVRTLYPYWCAGKKKPFVHYEELQDAILYLALRAEFPEEKIRALKELHEELSSFIQELPVERPQPPEEVEKVNGINGQ